MLNKTNTMINLINVFIFSLKQPYWYNPIIHSLGNTGFSGNVHAISTPFFTKLIDIKAYSGVNIRKKIYSDTDADGIICDLCCGTGFSTKPGHVGVDTSKEMLRYAGFFNPGSRYAFGNAETYGNDNQFDIVTCMFAFHEIPEEGHVNIIKNAIRLAKKNIIIVDISTDYIPSDLMLSGEPYILDYLDNIDKLFNRFSFRKETIIEGHVDKWTYKK